MTTTTLFDGTTTERLRITRTVVAEACMSHDGLHSTSLLERDGDYRCKIDERTEVVIRFDAGAETRIVVEVVEQRLTGFGRLRRQRTPALAVIVAEAVEDAVCLLDTTAPPLTIDRAA